jgi:alkanesulfonate monooxygenase SsuD/methylene tetrahydromethanopterin reductase-like flavin-dependent oxidoreductase (luciferase family)
LTTKPLPRVGVLTFQVLPYSALLEDVQSAERLGLDAVGLADQAVPPELPIMEAWTTL